jgi:DNA-binding transcriptional LysR family regulator
MSERGRSGGAGAGRWRGIELRHFEALAAIVAEGSFNRAARRLGYSQSAISQQIASLEQIVGHRVLERSSSSHRIELTPIGRLVLARGENIAREVGVVRAEVEAFVASENGRLRIGASPLACPRGLSLAVAHVRARRPDVRVQLVERNSERELLDLLAHGALEVAVVHGAPAEGTAEWQELFADEFGVVVAADAAGRARELGPAALERLEFVGLSGSDTFARMLAQLEARGVRLDVAVWADGIGTLCELVARGAAAGLLPKAFARGDLAERRVSVMLPEQALGVAWRVGGSPTWDVTELVAAAVAAARTLGRGASVAA